MTFRFKKWAVAATSDVTDNTKSNRSDALRGKKLSLQSGVFRICFSAATGTALIYGLLLITGAPIGGGNSIQAASAGPNYTSLLLHPPVKEPKNLVALTPIQHLGKNLLFDTSFSTPTGMACATCHVPETGFTGPDARINRELGVMPGVVPGRFGRRRPQMIAYAAFSPTGPYYDDDLGVWLGGTFWDGRTPDLNGQAKMPFLDANEMANAVTGSHPPISGGYSSQVVATAKSRPYAKLFEQVFGETVATQATTKQFYDLMTQAIAAYESSKEVNQFSSKYDSSAFGVPAKGKYKLTTIEERGRELFFGRAQCSLCHSSATLDPVLKVSGGRDTFTMYCYANIGVPKNADNPFYSETNSTSNPFGYNPLGKSFIDFGLGGNPNPSPGGDRFMTSAPGDIPDFRGLFKAPSVRNVDLRPDEAFDKAYMHNGVFKRLKDVVFFYNKRNIAKNAKGEEIAFDLRVGPPKGFIPLFAPPEVLDNVQNVAGVTPEDATEDTETNGQVGNLQLTGAEENSLVHFLKTLTDGYTSP